MTTQAAGTRGGTYAPVTDTPGNYVREEPSAHPPLDYAPYKSTALRHPRKPLIYLPQTISEITGPALARRFVGRRRRVGW